MNYIDLINAFEFSQFIYILLFLFLSICTIFIIFIVWFINKYYISKILYKPPLKIWETLIIAFYPAIKGTFYGTLPFLLAQFFVYFIYYGIKKKKNNKT